MNACFMFLQFDALLHLLIPSVKFYTSITVQCAVLQEPNDSANFAVIQGQSKQTKRV